jgi:glycosyltransferase involved in cell wall biosynthesis
MNSKQFRINWLTNLPAPYRIPIWNRLAIKTNLKVYFTYGEKNYRFWTFPKNTKWQVMVLEKKIYLWKNTEIILNFTSSFKIASHAEYLVISGWENPFYIAVLLLSRLTETKTSILYESTAATHRFNGKLALYLKGKILNLADSIVTVGNSSTEAVLAAGVNRSKILQIFNPVDVSFFHSYSMANRIETSSGHRFLFVGQLIERKNVKSLIHAFSKIARNGDTLSIAGDGILKNQIFALINDLKLNGTVNLVGQKSQDELAKIYANSDTLVMPSIEEVWGLVANEALASGMHAVVSEKSGVTDLISEMPGVYICKTDIESIAEAMDKSRGDFKVAIKQPEILKYTPERFADELLKWVMRR